MSHESLNLPQITRSLSRSSTPASRGSTSTMNGVETSVQTLLISTKQLLEMVTSWSRSLVSRENVYTVYYKLVKDFDVSKDAFQSAGIDMKYSLIPTDLKITLDKTLNMEAHSTNFDHYVPRIREIIILLLQGLKRKQARLRIKQDRKSPSLPARFESRPNESIKQPPNFPPPPKPDPFAALKNSEKLERRASKRYSQYKMNTPGNFYRNSIVETDSPESMYEQTPIDKLSPPTERLHLTTNSQFKILLYLTLGSTTKKVLHEGDITFAGLRLLFMEIFAFSPGKSAFPAIYIHDKESGVQYELEDVSDVRNKSNLILRVQEPDINKTLELYFSNLTSEFDELKKLVKTIPSMLPSISVSGSSLHNSEECFHSITKAKFPPISAIKEIRLDISSLLEHIASFESTTLESIQSLKNAQIAPALPIPREQKSLESFQQGTILQIDKFQDLLDDLKHNTINRKIPPEKKKLVELTNLDKVVSMKLDEFDSRFKKLKWKDIWEEELQRIVKEQQYYSMAEAWLLEARKEYEIAKDVFNTFGEYVKMTMNKRVPLVQQTGDGSALMHDKVCKELKMITVNTQKRKIATEEQEAKWQHELVQKREIWKREVEQLSEGQLVETLGQKEQLHKEGHNLKQVATNDNP